MFYSLLIIFLNLFLFTNFTYSLHEFTCTVLKQTTPSIVLVISVIKQCSVLFENEGFDIANL